ncbi:F-box/kelch-repeat protein At3g06240-like [Rutidosis leptorrhynchoides]|uniref:F-box/kelch-repeat protein At3g06240-like n=1 Tax=Rutidosis leptorrhynchoides TaxID=125765 RepID=UPI003A99F136
MTIAAFSLDIDKFREIGLPDSFNYDVDKFSRVFALGGKLVAILCDDLLSVCYELWVMEDYGVPKSWTKLCIFQNHIDLWSMFIAQVSNRDILLGNSHANQMLIYNMDERRCTSVTVEECEEVLVYGTYVESLESLKRFR